MFTRRAFLAALAAASARAAGPPVADPADLTLAAAGPLVRAGKMSPVELTRACLARIERYDDRLNAFVTVLGEQALSDARAAENQIRAGKYRGPLHGLPIGLKDNLDTAGVRTTSGDFKLRARIPSADAEVVRRLREAGAVFVGKLSMNTHAIGYDSVNPFTGPVGNPWAPDRIAGGSSGGSGSATAAGMCLAALGTDTGGSVRHPAACCGLAGLKPTHGRVSLRGVLPLVSSLDCVGPLARTALDCALIMRAIAGHDAKDRYSVDAPVDDYIKAVDGEIGKLRLGRPKGHFTALHPETLALTEAALKVFAGLTKGVEEVELPKSRPEGKQTQKEMREAATEKVFKGIDVLVTPTVSHPAHEIKEARMGRAPGSAGRHLALFNHFGWPGLSVPCGFTKAGLPVGVQLVAGPMKEGTLLALASAYERLTPWHRRRPPLG
jgi:aspartyl-tRNA(Asn)/glutamyl-tRNA(Gln) amidotransferase subunit A